MLEVNGTVKCPDGVQIEFVAFNADKHEVVRSHGMSVYPNGSFRALFNVPCYEVKFVKAVIYGSE
jgi:hypothetical protein